MNEQLFDLINSRAGNLPLLDALARFEASDGLYVLGLVAAFFGLMQLRRDRRGGLTIAVAAVCAIAVAGGLILASGTMITEARPFVHDSDTVLLVRHAADNSFPSDHMTMAATVAVVASLAWRRWAPLFLGLAAVMGLARIYVGVHYPGDILGGFAFGLAAAGAVWAAMQRVPAARLSQAA